MTSRAWRSAVLTGIVIASAVLAATRALAGPAPAGHPVPGRARDGSPAVARPVTLPPLGGVADRAASPGNLPVAGGVAGPAASPGNLPVVRWGADRAASPGNLPVAGGVAGPAASPGNLPVVGGVAGPVTNPITRPIIGLSAAAFVGPTAGPVTGSTVSPVTELAVGPVTGLVVGPVAGPGAALEPVGPFRWPLDGRPRVVVAFDPPAKPWLPGHRGVDLGATPAQLVYAAGPGTVAFAGRVAGVGVVSIDHAGGLRTTYEPVDAIVHAGDPVATGTPIGRIGARIAGCPAEEAVCLHWGLRRGDVYLDPLALLGLGRVRLLP